MKIWNLKLKTLPRLNGSWGATSLTDEVEVSWFLSDFGISPLLRYQQFANVSNTLPSVHVWLAMGPEWSRYVKITTCFTNKTNVNHSILGLPHDCSSGSKVTSRLKPSAWHGPFQLFWIAEWASHSEPQGDQRGLCRSSVKLDGAKDLRELQYFTNLKYCHFGMIPLTKHHSSEVAVRSL